jgi:hypothetical protein
MLDTRDFIVFDEIDKHGPQTLSRTYDFTPQELNRDELAAVGPVSIEATAPRASPRTSTARAVWSRTRLRIRRPFT